MASGATTVWPLGRFDPAHVIELTKRHGIAGWGGTVTHVLRLLDEPSIATIDPTSIVTVGIGGSASSPQLIRRTEERFPHLEGTFSSGYGSTESGGLISYASNAMLTASPDCVGPPLPTVAVRIVGPLGEDVAPGEEGEICARSPLVMQGYWRHPEADAEAFLPGRWLRTGDFGRMADGALFLASRRRDLIIRGGENVYPFEVEYRLEEHPDVVEAAVVGVDHPTLGQEVGAVVVVAPGSDVAAPALQDWCAEALSAYKVPSQVEVRTAPLPRNPTGKVMKHLLGGDESASGFVEE
jgi:acyl-CoA synthetase (AMP-forming)/AMP-acid ligase II